VRKICVSINFKEGFVLVVVGCYHRRAGKIEQSFAPHASEKLKLVKLLHGILF
jgi:hypothetical protein